MTDSCEALRTQIAAGKGKWPEMRFRGEDRRVVASERGGRMEWFWYGLRDGSNVPSYGSDAAVSDLSDCRMQVCSRPSRREEDPEEKMHIYI